HGPLRKRRQRDYTQRLGEGIRPAVDCIAGVGWNEFHLFVCNHSRVALHCSVQRLTGRSALADAPGYPWRRNAEKHHQFVSCALATFLSIECTLATAEQTCQLWSLWHDVAIDAFEHSTDRPESELPGSPAGNRSRHCPC